MFKLHLKTIGDVDILSVGFDSGINATNQDLVRYVHNVLVDFEFGGKLIKITGAASVPISYAIAHKVSHLYSAVAVFDPKLSGYVVAVSHGPKYIVGDLINE